MIRGLRHVGIPVDNLDLAADAFTALGAREISRGFESAGVMTKIAKQKTGYVRWVKMDFAGVVIELLSGPGAKHHLSFTVDDDGDFQHKPHRKPGVKINYFNAPGIVLEYVREENELPIM